MLDMTEAPFSEKFAPAFIALVARWSKEPLPSCLDRLGIFLHEVKLVSTTNCEARPICHSTLVETIIQCNLQCTYARQRQLKIHFVVIALSTLFAESSWIKMTRNIFPSLTVFFCLQVKTLTVHTPSKWYQLSPLALITIVSRDELARVATS